MEKFPNWRDLPYVLSPSTSIEFVAIPVAIGVFALLLLHVVAWGALGLRAARFPFGSAAATLCVGLATGLALLGAEMLLLGHLAALRPWAILASSVAASGVVLWQWRALMIYGRTLIELARELWRENRAIAFSCALLFGLVLIASLQSPFEIDEREYHWAGPLFWAENGRWVEAPFHNTNGPALAEMLFTFSAIFNSPIAAHWTHALFLVVAGAAVIALTELIGGRRIAALGVLLATPVLVTQAPIAYSDLATGGFTLAAIVALFSVGAQFPSLERNAPRVPLKIALLMGLLLSAAVSVKPFALVAAPLAALYAAGLLRARERELPDSQAHESIKTSRVTGRRLAWRHVLCVVFPVILTFVGWTVRTYALTGDWNQRSQEIRETTVRSSDDVRWKTGPAVMRVPSARDLVVLPFIPATLPIIGQNEPFGGRTALLLYLSPLGLLMLPQLPAATRRRATWLLTMAAFYFLVLGAIALKTRYHIFVWSVGACWVGLAYVWWENHSRPLLRRGLTAIFLGMMWIGMADIARVFLIARHLLSGS